MLYDTTLNSEQAKLLAKFINEEDKRFRAMPITFPMSGGPAISLVILIDRETGGNPPPLRMLEDYREHMRVYRYPVDRLEVFNCWAQEYSSNLAEVSVAAKIGI